MSLKKVLTSAGVVATALSLVFAGMTHQPQKFHQQKRKLEMNVHGLDLLQRDVVLKAPTSHV